LFDTQLVRLLEVIYRYGVEPITGFGVQLVPQVGLSTEPIRESIGGLLRYMHAAHSERIPILHAAQYADPGVSRRKFDREISEYRRLGEEYRRRGWILGGACVCCMYLADRALENEDAIIASALRVSDQLIQIRTLLHNGGGVPRSLLDSIAHARDIPIERLLPFEGRPLRVLYTEGICGGAVIPLGAAGTPRQEVHVPLAHQSALAGVLLAGASIRDSLRVTRPGTQVTRINVMQPLGSYLTQHAAKDQRGICICQDSDYRDVYQRKYPDTTEMNSINSISEVPIQRHKPKAG
jgi:hypothetical protein